MIISCKTLGINPEITSILPQENYWIDAGPM